MKTLIWSVAWGDYRFMVQNLMNSIRAVGIDYDILTFSDQPLANVMSCELDNSINLDFTQYWKFDYLNKVSELDYDLFVFIDSDHFFVRKPRLDFSEIIGEDPWHSFLESPLNSAITTRDDWWNVKNPEMVNMWREFGVHQKTVFNTNGGFWMCKKEFAKQAKDTVFLFRDFQRKRGLNLPEEVAIAVLSHMFSMDYTKRLHSNYMDIWASEWTGVLKDQIPNNSSWEFVEYMTGKKIIVNPSIVHAMRSKNALIQFGRQIFESTKDTRRFLTWNEVKEMTSLNLPKNNNIKSLELASNSAAPQSPSSSSSKKDCGCGRKKKADSSSVVEKKTTQEEIVAQ
jgi:hypothetical protein